MGKLSIYARNKLLDHIFNVPYVPASNVYLCLCTADPTESGTGAAMNEYPDSNGYARTAISFGPALNRRITQNADLTFPQTPGVFSPAITHWAICDNAAHGSGNMLAFGTVSPSFTSSAGEIPTVDSGDVYIEVGATASGAGFSTYCINALLDLMFRNIPFTSPSGNTFLSLYTEILTDADDDTTDKIEETATEYVRIEINPNGGVSPTWNLASNGALSNTHEIMINPDIQVDDWHTIVAIAIVTTSSGAGKILCYDQANIVDQQPRLSDLVRFLAGDLDIGLI
ncbi:MAG: hypothetical protein AB1847_21590 [bacterium]